MDKEYIERNALIAEYDRVHIGAPGGARKLMVDAPAVDVVEVMRCKDCIYWDNASNWIPQCRRLDGLLSPKEDDFCSYGERKNT